MFHFSYGDWIKSIDNPNEMPIISLPTDFSMEGRIGNNDVDNSWLIVTAAEQGTGKFGIFSLDKNLIKGSTVLEVHIEVAKLWETNREAFLYQHFLSFIYTAYVKGEDILQILEIIFEDLYKKRQKPESKL